MLRLILLLLIAVNLSVKAFAQGVGINNPTPDASALLDLTSTGKGLLLPRMTTVQRDAIAAPATSLMIYNTTTTRFEYFDGLAWVPLVGGGTLDQAYDFGGAGAGRTITADAGAVTITGADGLVSSGGSIGSGALVPAGSGTRLVWNPRKGAFRAGFAGLTSWDDVNVGTHSFATGFGTRASGIQSAAFGSNSVASGNNALAFGVSTTASGGGAFAAGSNTVASDAFATALGFHTTASGLYSTSIGTFSTAAGGSSTAAGVSNTAMSFGETVLGIGATTYTPSPTGAGSFALANGLDRLFVVGNAIDANNNSTVDAAERSDALVILKNGNTGVGTSTPVAKLHVRFTPTLNSITPTLRLEAAQAGSAANITFQNSITSNSASMGMLAGGDFGLHMGCNFGGCVIGTEAFRVKPNGNFGIGTTNAAARLHVVGSIRMVDGNQAAGRVLVSDANGTASWQALAPATATAWGLLGNAGTIPGTSFLGTTDNQPLVLRTNNAERIRVVGSGEVGIGTAAPTERLEVAGRMLLSNGFSADNAALLYRSNTDYLFLGPQSGSSANGAAIALYGSTNAAGGNTNGMDVNVPNGRVRFNHTNGGFEFRTNSTSGYTAAMELNDVGFLIGHNSTSRFISLSTGVGERVRITNAGSNLTAGGSWGVLSDRRVKSDISTLQYGLKEVMAMQPVRYFHHDTKGFELDPRGKSAEGKLDIGFIAQDLHAVVPEVVVKPADDTTSLWAVTYERLVPVLVKAIQEQQAQIEALRTELEEMKRK
ncbi:MAG: tail fiber domain-containing protein [Flavobacteriales bacterium]|nr:tail fiber domain-containing protein [Flavobacteriales bacterium]